MEAKDIDITGAIREALPVNTFLFNPSIAHISGDTYLVSVRSYIHNIEEPLDLNPKLMKNPQHPWGTDWAGTDVTYILPMIITEESVQPITTGKWPIEIPVQDMRIYRFVKNAQEISFILTFNEMYTGERDIVIKGGDTCDEFCYLIGWGYLLVNLNTLHFEYLPGKNPLCMNISNPVEKNWSLWQYQRDEKFYLMVSYALTPLQTAFSIVLNGISKGEMVANTQCRITTPRTGKYQNVLKDLENFYSGLFVSLSSPSYQLDSPIPRYQAVGHIKVKLDAIHQLAQEGKNNNLTKFTTDYVYAKGKKHFNPAYIYFMFIYQFQVVKSAEDTSVDIGNGAIELTGSADRIYALVTHISPAFIVKTTEYDYFLNFPSGMMVNDQNTVISYGDGDATSHLLTIPNELVNDLLIPVTELTAEKFQFLHFEKEPDGMVKM